MTRYLATTAAAALCAGLLAWNAETPEGVLAAGLLAGLLIMVGGTR